MMMRFASFAAMWRSSRKASANWPYRQAKKRPRLRAGGDFGGGDKTDPNLTQPIIINATIIQPSNITQTAALIGAGSAIIATIVTIIAQNYIERRKFENELRIQLRQERKILYINIFNGLYSIKKDYKKIMSSFQSNEYKTKELIISVVSDLDSLRPRIDDIITKHKPEIEMIGNPRIIYLLESSYIILSSEKFYQTQEELKLGPKTNENCDSEVSKLIRGVIALEIILEKIESNLIEMEKITRSELVPLPEKAMKHWWQFWRGDEYGR